MRVKRFGFSVLFLVALAAAVLAQDKTTGAIKGKVRVEKGSPSGVAVILMQGDQEVSRTATDKRGDFQLSRVVPGTYSVTYNAVDASGNHATQVTRTVVVQDTIAPVITQALPASFPGGAVALMTHPAALARLPRASWRRTGGHRTRR